MVVFLAWVVGLVWSSGGMAWHGMEVFLDQRSAWLIGLSLAVVDGFLTAIIMAWRFVDGSFVEDRDRWLIFPTPNSQPLSSI